MNFQELVAEAKSKIKELTVAEFAHEKLQGETHILVDVREDNEWLLSRAKGATHISKGLIERDIGAMIPDRSSKIVLYCQGGARSALAAEAIQKLGYENVYSLAGGFNSWCESGLPVEENNS